MQQIFKGLLFLAFSCLASAPSLADANTLEQFILQRQGTDAIAREAADSNRAFRDCFATSENLICVDARKYPNIQDNPNARLAILQGLAMSVKRDLYFALAKRSRAANLSSPGAASDAFAAAASRGDFLPPHVDFATFAEQNRLAAAASIHLGDAAPFMQQVYKKPEFVRLYCQTLYPKAEALMAKGSYSNALAILKELHDLRFANIDAYLLAAKAFYHDRQPTEAKKILEEISKDFADVLTPAQAEAAGDMFMELHCEAEAAQMYNLSIEKQNAK